MISRHVITSKARFRALRISRVRWAVMNSIELSLVTYCYVHLPLKNPKKAGGILIYFAGGVLDYRGGDFWSLRAVWRDSLRGGRVCMKHVQRSLNTLLIYGPNVTMYGLIRVSPACFFLTRVSSRPYFSLCGRSELASLTSL
jgi:hypothetical protein